MGFFIIPLVLKNQIESKLPDYLNASIKIDKINFNPYTLKFEIIQLTLRDKKKNEILSFSKLLIKTDIISSIKNDEINFSNISLEELNISIKEDQNKKFNFQKIIKDNEEKEENKSLVEDKKDKEIPKIKIQTFSINNSTYMMFLQKDNFEISFDNFNYKVTNFNTYKENITSSLKLFINNRSEISIATNFKLFPLILDSKVSVKNLILTDFNELIKNQINATISKSELNFFTNINIIEENSFKINLSNLLLDIKKLDLSLENKNILGFENFKLKASNISYPKTKIAISEVSLLKPYVNIIKNSKNINLENIVKSKKQTEEKKSSNKKENIDISAKNIKIIEALVKYEDKNQIPKTKTTINKINISLDSYINKVDTLSNLSIKGFLNNSSLLKINSSFYNDWKKNTKTNILVKNLELKDFSSYSVEAIGQVINKGELDLNLVHKINKSNLNTSNNIQIKDIQLGETLNEKKASILPLNLALALLEDSKGVINLDVPINGNLKNPKFDISPVVISTFTNIILKAVSSPFTLLAKAFGFNEEELKAINFEFASSELEISQKKTLQNIIIILKKKKDFKLKINPSYDIKFDIDTLKKLNKNVKKEELNIIAIKLAKNRALVIKNYLLKKGIRETKIIISSKIQVIKNSKDLVKIALDIKN